METPTSTTTTTTTTTTTSTTTSSPEKEITYTATLFKTEEIEETVEVPIEYFKNKLKIVISKNVYSFQNILFFLLTTAYTPSNSPSKIMWENYP